MGHENPTTRWFHKMKKMEGIFLMPPNELEKWNYQGCKPNQYTDNQCDPSDWMCWWMKADYHEVIFLLLLGIQCTR